MASSSEQPGNGAGGSGTGIEIDPTFNLTFTTDQCTEFGQIFLQTQLTPIQIAFALTIGAIVPDTVQLLVLPERIVTIVPQFQGYLYFALTDGRIVVVHPTTHKVVMILYPTC